MTTDNTFDVGPAAPPPAWCEPGAVGEWAELALEHEHGGGQVCLWNRDVGPNVWIECEDTVSAGRVIRTPPAIYVAEQSSGFTAVAARQLAAALLDAADLIDE